MLHNALLYLIIYLLNLIFADYTVYFLSIVIFPDYVGYFNFHATIHYNFVVKYQCQHHCRSFVVFFPYDIDNSMELFSLAPIKFVME